MIRKFYDTILDGPSGGGEPTREEVGKVVTAVMGAMQERFEEEQKKPFQYVVAYYDKKDKLLGYHVDTFCNLTQKIENGKRYNGENPYNQLATIRKNLDYTLDMTEEKAKGNLFGGLNMLTKNKFYKDLTRDDVFIEAQYLEEGIPPQRFVWEEITKEDGQVS